MYRLRNILMTAIGLLSLLASSCVHEFPVTDYSFEFSAQVVYDQDNDQHRLTLTKVMGECEDDYKVVFTLDGEPSVSLTDMNGRTYEGVMNENFKDISTRTYTLSEMKSGEHTLSLEISSENYSQTIETEFTVMDYTFEFDCSVEFDKVSKAHSLKVTLDKGDADQRYRIDFTIDNREPTQTYQEQFNDKRTKSFDIPSAAPGKHTLNVTISTDRHIQKMDIPFTVTDYSFKFKADVEYDRDNLSHMLFLTLMSGSRDEIYDISYTVDGGHGVKLTDITGKELAASFTERFNDATVKSYDLSRSDIGKHTLNLIISTGNYRQEIEVFYSVVALPFEIHTEMNTSSSSTSALMLSLKSGSTTTNYDVTILVDGETLKGMNPVKVNFASTPIKTLTLPLLRPGRHSVSAKVTDGHTTQTASLSYTEPVRYPYVDITLKHNDSNGRHVAVVGSNPYGIVLTFKTSLQLTGKSTYCISTYEYYYSDISYASKTKTLSDSRSSSDDYDNVSVDLIDRDALALKMTSSYELSNRMEYRYDPGSGGEDSGREWWEKTGTERAYYSITQEDLKIDISGEKVSGVTLRVTNNIGKMTLNGKASSSGLTQINL